MGAGSVVWVLLQPKTPVSPRQPACERAPGHTAAPRPRGTFPGGLSSVSTQVGLVCVLPDWRLPLWPSQEVVGCAQGSGDPRRSVPAGGRLSGSPAFCPPGCVDVGAVVEIVSYPPGCVSPSTALSPPAFLLGKSQIVVSWAPRD